MSSSASPSPLPGEDNIDNSDGAGNLDADDVAPGPSPSADSTSGSNDDIGVEVGADGVDVVQLAKQRSSSWTDIGVEEGE